MANRYQTFFTISLGALLCLNFSATPNLAETATQSDDVIQGLPGRRLSGASRNPNGHIGQMPLAALIPETNLGITTAALPKFLFYLPGADEVRDIEFVLYDEADNLVYDTTVSVSPTAGILTVDLAEVDGLPPLQLDQNYHWYFCIIADDRSEDMVLDGWTRRVELSSWLQTQALSADVSQQLGAATPLEQARLLYQEAQLWHDAAVILEELHQANPGDRLITEEWQHLLQTANLTDLGAASITRVSVLDENDEMSTFSLMD